MAICYTPNLNHCVFIITEIPHHYISFVHFEFDLTHCN